MLREMSEKNFDVADDDLIAIITSFAKNGYFEECETSFLHFSHKPASVIQRIVHALAPEFDSQNQLVRFKAFLKKAAPSPAVENSWNRIIEVAINSRNTYRHKRANLSGSSPKFPTMHSSF